jgi:hypothetical protein
MKLKIIDGKGNTIEMECNPKDKLSTLISNYETKYKKDHPNVQIRSITFNFNGEAFGNEDNDSTLEDLDLEDGCQIISSFFYNGGLI